VHRTKKCLEDSLLTARPALLLTAPQVKFGAPHWVDFGQELEHSPDGKVRDSTLANLSSTH
jgi:hypothetical protein